MAHYPIFARSIQQGKEFRLPAVYLVFGIGSTTSFLIAAATSSITALSNLGGSFRYPVPTAIGFGCFWFSLACIGGSLILAYWRVRLFVSAQVVRTTGCFRTREVQLADVVRAEWKSWPKRGYLVLHDHAGQLVVDFNSFCGAEQLELIVFLRERLDEHLQEGWERFQSRQIPQSKALQRKRDRERRLSHWLMLILGPVVIGIGTWDP